MNKDVKIGLAIGLLLLVVLFVVIVFKTSKPGDRGETTAPETTTGTPPAGEGSPADEYFSTPETTTDTVTLDLGGDTPGGETVKTDELSPEAKYYLEQLREEPSTPATTETITPEPLPVVTPPTYVVKPGDFLSTISQKVYGTARYWERIARANDIDDPTLLRPGMVLTIPPLSEVAPAPAPAAAFDAADQTHTVVEGDTLSDISKKYYGTVRYMQLIKEANRLDSDDLLRVGSVLRIPKVTSAPAGVSPAPVAGESYVVQEGDTLGSISQRFYGTARLYTLIMEANGIDDPRRLPAGRRLVIPPRPGGEAPAPAAPRDSGEPGLRPGESRYVVEYGDTLSEIAASELGSSRYYIDLMRRNDIHNGASLREGQVIIIPSRHSLSVLSTEAPDR